MLQTLLLSLVLTAGPESPLEQGARAVEELRADDAVRLLEAARRAGPWQHDEHVRLYEQLGIAYAYQGKGDDARVAFERLLALDPGHVLRYTLSPKVTFLFEKARESARKQRAPTLDVAFPRDGKVQSPLPLTFEVLADPLGFLRRVEVRYRLKGEAPFRLLDGDLAPAGSYVQLALPAEALERDVVREFFAVVKDQQGNEVLRLGSETFPREASARYEPPVRWYQRWWVWALAGTVVATGVGVGVYAGTRPQPTTIPLTISTSP